MTQALAKPSQRAQNIGSPDNRPKLGEWYWVKTWKRVTHFDGKKNVDGEGEEERLLCVTHLASNHVQFSESCADGGTSTYPVRYRDLMAKTRPEPRWKEIIEQWVEEKKAELQNAVKELADMVGSAGLIQDDSVAPTLLPALTRQSPEEAKKSLIRLKEKSFPQQQKNIEGITQCLVAYQKDLCLPMRAEQWRMQKAMESVDSRLFALELYAGLFQQCEQIAKGEPAPAETPISVRQMIRYMDEETLIDYGSGGMDFTKLGDFDEWVAKPENRDRMCPEPRCVVALQVRRRAKDYGPCRTIGEALMQGMMHDQNRKTYLLIRNGGNLHRLVAEIDFSPRLLPFRDEFTKPFAKKEYSWKEHKDKEVPISPDDLDYDDHVAERLKDIYEYNRVMFLLQGLLDRSKVFSPHPPINLADQKHVEQYFKAVFDEELGLPSANPPTWEAYRDDKNARIRVGSFVWSTWYDEEKDYEYCRYGSRDRLKESRSRPEDILRVDSVKRDRSAVRVSWPWGERRSYWRLSYWDRQGLEKTVDRMRHAWLPIKEVFNVSAYRPGEFKQFLCDAYLKGAYLEWAPPLLDAEDWHRKRKEQKA